MRTSFAFLVFAAFVNSAAAQGEIVTISTSEELDDDFQTDDVASDIGEADPETSASFTPSPIPDALATEATVTIPSTAGPAAGGVSPAPSEVARDTDMTPSPGMTGTTAPMMTSTTAPVAAGETTAPAAGDTIAPAAGDTIAPAAGTTDAPAAEEDAETPSPLVEGETPAPMSTTSSMSTTPTPAGTPAPAEEEEDAEGGTPSPAADASGTPSPGSPTSDLDEASPPVTNGAVGLDAGGVFWRAGWTAAVGGALATLSGVFSKEL